MTENKKLVCYNCQKELVASKTNFSYLGHSFFTEVLRCPDCGLVFIPEELVKGRISEVEMQMEDK